MAASVAFKDLCLDVDDTDAMATFWSATLGLTAARRGSDAVLRDPVDEHTVWLNRVPEPRTAKNRVHLDVHTGDLAGLLGAGATVLDDSQRWTLLADPEGGEFCAFVRPPDRLPDYRLYEVVVDAVDPMRIGTWWADRFGAEPERQPEDGSCAIPAVAGLPWELVFQAVPEPKAGKNRVHWDVWGDTDELLGVGARLLRRRDDDDQLGRVGRPRGQRVLRLHAVLIYGYCLLVVGGPSEGASPCLATFPPCR